jgi:hypothetical protein
LSTGDTLPYHAGIEGGAYERGLGTWNDTAKTLTRTTIRESSTGSAIAWTAAPTVWSDGPHQEDLLQIGTTATTACAGNDARLSDARTPISHTHSYEPVQTAASQSEMEVGTQAAIRSMSPLRVAQAIAALGGSGGGLQVASGADGFGATETPADLVITGLAFEPKFLLFIAVGGGGATGFSQAYATEDFATAFWTNIPSVGTGGSSGVMLVAEDADGNIALNETGCTFQSTGFTIPDVYTYGGSVIFSYQWFALG